MYTSELAWHQYRVIFLRYNLDLRSIFGVVNTPVHNHAKPSNNVWSPLTIFYATALYIIYAWGYYSIFGVG